MLGAEPRRPASRQVSDTLPRGCLGLSYQNMKQVINRLRGDMSWKGGQEPRRVCLRTCKGRGRRTALCCSCTRSRPVDSQAERVGGASFRASLHLLVAECDLAWRVQEAVIRIADTIRWSAHSKHFDPAVDSYLISPACHMRSTSSWIVSRNWRVGSPLTTPRSPCDGTGVQHSVNV